MKRKFLVLLSLIAIVALLCTSCDIINSLIPDSSDLLDEPCEHTYSDKWSTNATEHWHAATCEHATEKSDVANHADTDENGKCDVCDYEIGHEHTWADAWTSDETHHWKVPTCSHTDEKGELAAHTDANFDNSCDVCSAALEIEVPADIAAAIELVLLRAGAVSGGSLYYEYLGRNHEDINPHVKKNIEYLFGSDSVYMNVSSWAKQPITTTKDDLTDFAEESDVMKGWYQLLADDSVFSVTQTSYDDYVGEYELNAGADINVMDGYYCAVSTLADAYGPENLLATLYQLSQSDSASEYVTTFDADTLTYAFSFNYLYVNTDTAEGEGDHVDYYEVEVSFTYAENGALTALDVVTDCYSNSLENEIDNDYTYDQNSGTIDMKDTALADTYTFEFTQTVGERTYVNENPKSKFVPTDYDFFSDADCTTSINGTITVTQNTSASVFVGGFIPEGSSILYVVDMVELEGDESLSLWTYGNQIGLYAKTVGTYTVNFTVAGVEKSFTVVVEAGEDVGGGDEDEQPENSIAVEITGANTYTWDTEVSFTATESGDYTFTVPAGLGAWSVEDYNAWREPTIDPLDPEKPSQKNGGSFTVSIAAGETYTFYTTCETAGTYYITYSVSDYTGGGNEGGGNSGVATTVVGGTYLGSYTYGTCTLVIDTDASTVTMDGNVYSYTFADGVITVYLNGNAMSESLLSVTLGSDGVPTSFVYNGTTYTVSEGGNDDAPTSVVEGTYLGTDAWDTQALTVIVEGNTVTFNYDHPMSGSSSIVATYEIVNGEVVLYAEDGSVINPLSGRLAIDETGLPVSADYNGSAYTLVAGEAECEHEYVEGVCTLCGEACEHEYEQNTFYHPALVSATCVAPGAAVYECIYCRDYYTEETPIDPEAHNFSGEEEILSPANCATETDGLKKVSCANGCGATENQTISYYFSHNWDVQRDEEATCTTDGGYYAVCTICELVDSYESEAFGHYAWGVACGESGTCVECGETFTKEHSGSPATCTEAAYCYNCWSYYGEALGHMWADGVCSTCEETCEHEEYAEGACTVCGAACDHEYEENTWYHPEMESATCVTPGVAVYECIYCRDYYTEETAIDPEAHNFSGEEEILSPANCATETNGLKKVWCSNEGCTATTEEEIFYHFSHNWDVQKDEEATCTTDGGYYAVCTICEEVDSYDREASGHYNWYLSCGESGECLACGETFTMPDHSGSPATCTEAAYCYNCWSNYGEPLGHDFVDGVCTVCDEAEAAETVGSGTEEDPYVLSTLPESVTFNSDTFNKVYYIFTANETGTITFTWPTADSWVDIFELNENGENTGNDASDYSNETFSYDITEGTSYRFSLGTWAVEGEVTITITVA